MDSLASIALLALAEEPVRQSYLSWMFNALGPFYGLMIPLAGFAVFVGACLVVALARRPSVIAAFLVFLPLPLLIGAFGSITGAISSFSIIAMSEVAPKPAEVAAGISTALFASLVGLLVTFPAYFVTSVGLFVRTVTWRGNSSK